jgi:Ca2+-binding RTX toxin-like protein
MTNRFVVANATGGNDIIDVFGAGSSVAVLGLAAQISITNSEGANDSLVINGLGGDDGITATTLPSGVIKLTLDGGAGDDTILGSQGADVILGGEGDDVLIGGEGDDVLIGGPGNDILDGGPGDNTVIQSLIGGGSPARTTVQGFEAGAGAGDRIDLRAIDGADDFDWVLAHATEVDGSAVLDLGNGEEMMLLGVSVASLHADDFLLA